MKTLVINICINKFMQNVYRDRWERKSLSQKNLFKGTIISDLAYDQSTQIN